MPACAGVYWQLRPPEEVYSHENSDMCTVMHASLYGYPQNAQGACIPPFPSNSKCRQPPSLNKAVQKSHACPRELASDVPEVTAIESLSEHRA
jgi:hypothetical protein